MKEISLTQLADLHVLFRAYRSHDGLGWLFRGHADATWPLIPRAGRPEFNNGRDLGRFNAWRKRAVAYSQLPENDWECLAVAQHYGLATRLLDWSLNPLVAAYFAVSELPDHNGAVFCYSPDCYVDPKVLSLDAMLDQVACFQPRAIDPRVHRQSGVFTTHSDPTKPLKASPLPPPLAGPNLVRILIPAGMKLEIRQHLADYGFHAHGVFPDLDGLSRHVNWETSEMVRRRAARSRRKSDDQAL